MKRCNKNNEILIYILRMTCLICIKCAYGRYYLFIQFTLNQLWNTQHFLIYDNHQGTRISCAVTLVGYNASLGVGFLPVYGAYLCEVYESSRKSERVHVKWFYMHGTFRNCLWFTKRNKWWLSNYFILLKKLPIE